MSSSADEWPLVGRVEELALLRQLRSGSPAVSAVISGPAGVGKSRLAHEAVQEAANDGWATLGIRGSVGYAGVALGPFRTVLGRQGPAELTELTESVTHQLVSMRSPRGLLMLVDDGQALDEFSAALLHQVVAAGLAVAIITTRAGAPVPAALTDIWKDGFAQRVELQNLSRLETLELLAKGLDGNVQDSSANRIWNVTEGNPLYLREVVLSSRETGALSRAEGEWRWRGEWATGARLQEIVGARLGTLDPDELTAMELLALAGSLPLSLLAELATAAAVQRLEGRGLVTTEQSGHRLEVSIAQPLHAEVLRRKMPALQQRSVRHTLVDALLASGARRTADRVRIACWSLGLGVEVDPMTLSLGSDASLFSIGQAISVRLQEILPHALGGLPTDGPVVRQNHRVAVQLARASYEQNGGLREGVALANTLAWVGATAEAEIVLAELSVKAEATDDRIRLALGLAWVRFWGRFLVEEARAGLVEAADEAERCGGDPSLLADIHQDLAGIALNTAQPAAALTSAQSAAAAQGVPLSRSVAAPAAAAALVYLGRCGEAVALVDAALPPAQQSGHPLSVAQLLFARAAAQSRLGEFEEARRLTEWLRDVALADGLLDATAIFGVLLGEILLGQGRPGSAGRIFRDSAGLLAERDLFGYRPWALSGLARARALSGEEESAESALDEARRSQPISRNFDMSLYLAESEIHRLAGRTEAAATAARSGAAWARDAGMVGDEVQGLQAWVRVEPSAEAAARLAELADMTDSPLVRAIADHARAVTTSDADLLRDVSERFAAMSAWWFAAEAAAAAAVVLERRHQARPAAAAARLAENYGQQCETLRLPSADVLTGPGRLTNREREVATLAATGRSTKEIAERMHVSPRTVENHLHHAYVKLGVTDRSALASALAPGARTQN